jgi:DNA-binding NarL/FixJ family response regulator
VQHDLVRWSAVVSDQPFDGASHGAPGSPPVLVVDQDGGAAEATLTVLMVGGYPGVKERDGDAALRHVRTELVRLVVSELYVACAEGPCIVTVLKGERERLPRLRVLIYTQYGQDSDVEWALATGCDAFVLKSADARVLVREVARLDGAPRPGRQS